MSSYDTSREALKATVLEATQAAHALSAPSDIAFHRTLSSEFSTELDSVSDRLLNLTSQLLHLVNDKVEELEEDDVLEEYSFEGKVVESVDGLLELVDGLVDEHKYGNKQVGSAQGPVPSSAQQQQQSGTGPQQSAMPVASSSKSRLDSNLVYAKHLSKPQLAFASEQRPSNQRGQVFSTAQYPHTAAGVHPLAEGLHQAAQTLPSLLEQLSSITPQAPASFEETPFLYVDSISTLDQLFKDLEGATEIAIDLEHHDFRTYAGITCLMQLSLPGKDYIIDVLQPAVRARLHRLNKWTTDPTVVKVLHGAKSDVQWLQRDFGVFLVGLFDTFFASKLLAYPYHGLANLLERFCNFAADKRFQMADWRIRPLPQDMLYYARADTHFLLFIFHSLLAAIKSSQPDVLVAFKNITDHSQEVAGRVYEHPAYDRDTGLGGYGWRGTLQKFNKHLVYRVPALPHEYTVPHKTSLEFHLFRALHDWRDQVARETDEAPRYILSLHLLFKLAEERPDSMTKLRILLGPQVKGKEELVGLLKREIDRWEELGEESASRQGEAERGGLDNGLVKDEITVDRPDALWAAGTRPSLAASSSALAPSSSQKSGSSLATSSSALLGSAPRAQKNIQKTSERYQAALQKAFGAVSAIPKKQAPQPEMPEQDDSKATFIPLGDRKSAHRPLGATQIRPADEAAQIPQPAASSSKQPQEDTEMDQDVIIVSEHRRKSKPQHQQAKKKRSHSSTAETESSAPTSSNESKKSKKARKEKPEAMAPYDYSQETSILDAKPPPSSKSGDKKKDKREKQKTDGKEPRAFKAPPRDRFNAASGSKSQTFKS